MKDRQDDKSLLSTNCQPTWRSPSRRSTSSPRRAGCPARRSVAIGGSIEQPCMSGWASRAGRRGAVSGEINS